MKRLLLILVMLTGCSGCSMLIPDPDVGPYRTPIHAYGFVSCTGNTPIDWIRGDAASDPALRVATLAHEAQHILDFVRAGGCKAGYAAYVANPLWFEARAYCAAANALAAQRLAPPVVDQLPLMTLGLKAQTNVTYGAALAALQDACFVRIYDNP